MQTAVQIGLCECGCGGITPLATRNETRRSRVEGQPHRFMYGHRLSKPNEFMHRADGVTIIFIKHRGEKLECLIDTADFNLVKNQRWNIAETCNLLYVVPTLRRKPRLSMHQLLLPGIKLVDHRDRNGLNNCRHNLREATHSQNMINRRPKRKTSSKYRGVVSRKKGKFEANIRANSKPMYLGQFDSEIDAAHAYDTAATKYHGEFANLNFPICAKKDYSPRQRPAFATTKGKTHEANQ